MLSSNQEKLIYWINERESIRKKKEAGLEKPWSSDKIMQETYFCNVNREDDKVTKWIRENWTYPTYIDPDFEEQYVANHYDTSMIAARIFNLPSTLEKIRMPIDDDSSYSYWLEHLEYTLKEIKAKEDRIWNGAYIVSTNGRKVDKITHCLDIFKKLENSTEITKGCKTLKQAHSKLSEVYGLASFLAAQVVADLKNTLNHPLYNAEDKFTFSAPGPGSLRGLSWFWEEKVTSKNYHSKIEQANEILQYELDEDILNILCMQNLQNCFCEYDKYMRVLSKTGKSKRKYVGV